MKDQDTGQNIYFYKMRSFSFGFTIHRQYVFLLYCNMKGKLYLIMMVKGFSAAKESLVKEDSHDKWCERKVPFAEWTPMLLKPACLVIQDLQRSQRRRLEGPFMWHQAMSGLSSYASALLSTTPKLLEGRTTNSLSPFPAQVW